MADDETKPIVVLPAAEAKRRFAIYFAVKLAGYAVLFGGIILVGRGALWLGWPLVLIGVASMFLKPRMLRVTTAAPTRTKV